jgi:hypothetical protein
MKSFLLVIRKDCRKIKAENPILQGAENPPVTSHHLLIGRPYPTLDAFHIETHATLTTP